MSEEGNELNTISWGNWQEVAGLEEAGYGQWYLNEAAADSSANNTEWDESLKQDLKVLKDILRAYTIWWVIKGSLSVHLSVSVCLFAERTDCFLQVILSGIIGLTTWKRPMLLLVCVFFQSKPAGLCLCPYSMLKASCLTLKRPFK